MPRRDSLLRTELKQTRPFRSEAEEAALAIQRTADLVRRRIAAVLEPHAISMQQYNVLRILRGAGPGGLPTLEVSERLIEQTPGITRLMAALEQRSLVRRERAREDRRVIRCFITPAALTLLATLDEPVGQSAEESVSSLTPKERRALLVLLERIRRGRE
jgi:DNA-binding MarR family transcriptional regulator